MLSTHQVDLRLAEWHPLLSVLLTQLDITLSKLPDREGDMGLYVRLIGSRETLVEFYCKTGAKGSKAFLEKIKDYTSLNDDPSELPIEIDIANIIGSDPRFYVHVRSGGHHVELIEAPSEHEALKDFSTWCSEKSDMYSIQSLSAKCTNQNMSVTFWTFNGLHNVREE